MASGRPRIAKFWLLTSWLVSERYIRDKNWLFCHVSIHDSCLKIVNNVTWVIILAEITGHDGQSSRILIPLLQSKLIVTNLFIFFIHHAQKHMLWGRYWSQGGPQIKKIFILAFFSFSVVDILKMASGRPYTNNFALLTPKFVTKTNIRVKNCLFWQD